VTPVSQVAFYHLTSKVDADTDNQKLSQSGVDPKVGLGQDARIYYGVITHNNQMPCSTGVLENNWTGPPA
jgi:hypothetical protein